jgi:hypothetical protein
MATTKFSGVSHFTNRKTLLFLGKVSKSEIFRQPEIGGGLSAIANRLKNQKEPLSWIELDTHPQCFPESSFGDLF